MTRLFLNDRQEKKVYKQEKTTYTDSLKEGRSEKWKSPQAEKHKLELVKEEYSATQEVWEVERNQMTQQLSRSQPMRPVRKEKSLLGKKRGFYLDPCAGKEDVVLRGF